MNIKQVQKDKRKNNKKVLTSDMICSLTLFLLGKLFVFPYTYLNGTFIQVQHQVSS